MPRTAPETDAGQLLSSGQPRPPDLPAQPPPSGPPLPLPPLTPMLIAAPTKSGITGVAVQARQLRPHAAIVGQEGAASREAREAAAKTAPVPGEHSADKTGGGPGGPGLSAGGGTHRRGLVALGSKPVLPAVVSEDLSELTEAAKAALAQLAAVLDPGGAAAGRSSSPPSHAPAPTPPATNGGEQQEVAQVGPKQGSGVQRSDEVMSPSSHIAALLRGDWDALRIATANPALPPERLILSHMWHGDVRSALEVAVMHCLLSADLVSMSARLGRPAWVATTRLYAAQQEVAGQAHVAAMHLVAIGDRAAAEAVYRRVGLMAEAEAVRAAGALLRPL
ncbi:hypothetical protein V8C86DRAFT_2589570 [Haematococcus lacustris]